MDVKEYFKIKAARVDEWLNRLLPSEQDAPAIIHEAMRYSVFAGGKRLRPILTIATGEMFGAAEEELLPAACVLEMIHTYSLIHDDLPAMDNDTLRRGRPTNHMVYGEALAILAGDALLTQAFLTLARTTAIPVERRGRLMSEVAEAAGTRGALIGGQVLDLQFEGKSITGPELEVIHRSKTGALIRCAVRLGAILGGAHEADLTAVTQYSEKVGLAFQIADDVLDATSTSEELGKTAGKDAAVKKATYTSLYGIEGAKQRAQTLYQEALAALQSIDRQTPVLAALAQFIVERKS
ncbi:MAG: polyprenyl synthetase family protein [Acidobacteria bacterium]|nr:polyprenyl synthetase family protein [Acidobacteriota bacterium]MBI3422632.1 polyprenyl synthetase family protein [Acidobacteriota bacterium]